MQFQVSKFCFLDVYEYPDVYRADCLFYIEWE